MPRELFLYRRVNWKYLLGSEVELTLPAKLIGKASSYTSPYLVVVRGVARHTVIAPHLCIKAGYAWDGASGPTVDTKATMFVRP